MPITTAATSPNILDDRQSLVAWFDRTRARSAALFDMIDDAAYYTRPISLRHPIVFYEGHLPAFAINVLIKKGLGRPGVDARLETLFARGIDPDSAGDAERTAEQSRALWPSRAEVKAYVAAADALLRDALLNERLVRDDVAVLRGGEAVFTVIEHEAMHQETLLYMWHQLPHGMKRKPAGHSPWVSGRAPARSPARVDEGRATLGAARGQIPFGWDNEFGRQDVDVPAFDIDVVNVTNADWLEFLEGGCYATEKLWEPEDWAWVRSGAVSHPAFWIPHGNGYLWKGQFEDIDLPLAWPVYVSHAEARAFARWAGRRLPTEAEYHRAAFGEPGSSGTPRAYPWGEQAPEPARGHFDFAAWDPAPAGSHPLGASAWGVHDLMGNGWEWTSTVFAPFDGFEPMASYPEYSADFFDGKHYVLKGASSVTARELLRPSFRNWFRPHYPYIYAGFRTVSR
ncbi:MAG: SUMF1/EgtB/PvdO family nonheme iron enzyme [Acidobacteriota bacterium]|nr:SUMF1/EgtB/PvdO family nonheme iron enzyme [Acidobacteriota bacterium]